MNSRLPQLYLFSAPSSHLAFLKQKMNELETAHPDVHILADDSDMDNFQPLTIEHVRDLRQAVSFQPYQADYSTYVIIRVDEASIPAQNALLKSLEEPPTHAIFLLTATQLEKVLPTVRSRCVIVKGERSGEESAANPDASAVLELLQLKTEQALPRIFELSEKYKDKKMALQFLDEVAGAAHQQIINEPNRRLVVLLQNLLSTHSLIQKNVNVRLALEHFLIKATA